MSFFFNDTATTEIYTLSLHDALPILGERGGVRPLLERVDQGPRPRAADEPQARLRRGVDQHPHPVRLRDAARRVQAQRLDRKSTRLNSSHANISYAVFCLKKKNTIHI